MDGPAKTNSKVAFEVFLADLAELSRKHGMILWSCGSCCKGINVQLDQDAGTPGYAGCYTARFYESEAGEVFCDFVEWVDWGGGDK